MKQKTISYRGAPQKDEKLLGQQAEIPFITNGKTVTIPVSLLSKKDHSAITRALSKLDDKEIGVALDIDLPEHFALAQGLPVPPAK
jgi:hypothetical protein